VYGALAHFYLDDDDDLNESECALGDARQFITGKFAPHRRRVLVLLRRKTTMMVMNLLKSMIINGSKRRKIVG
jgi:hypothetical protein